MAHPEIASNGRPAMQRTADAIYRELIRLPRRIKQLIMMLADGLVFLPLALWSAFALRTGEALPQVLIVDVGPLALVPLLSLPALAATGLYRAVIRYMGPGSVLAVLQGAGLSTLILAAVVLVGDLAEIPQSVIPLYALTALLMVGGSRFGVRMWFQRAARVAGKCEPVAIYGAGATGAQLAGHLLEATEMTPVGFLDDDPGKQGTEVRGIPVFDPQRFAAMIDSRNVTRVLLAMPSAPHERRRQILQHLEPWPVHVQTVPILGDLLSGEAEIGQIREVDVEDVLGRNAVVPDMNLLEASVAGRVVAITGAGGSIGSELCRQIARLGPTRLILIEQSEFNLYQVERGINGEAQAEGRALEILPFLSSVEERDRMAQIFQAYSVQTVYHAAAYKHVPLVEHNVIQGVRNNAFGTWQCARAAQDAGVDRFILISTDKAVRPTNVMGASKRLAELILQALARRAAEEGGPRFAMVRFGNVLDSSGSVVPLFREQIRHGGPVTVTHPEVTRYFMTIPEAASLVLQAGTMAEGGEVFVLDMGEPVQIEDLARRLIRLSGLTVRDDQNPHGQIEIHYTGLRPGEKLYEELLLGDNVNGTRHPMIMRAREWELPWQELEQHLAALDEAARSFDAARVRKLLGRAMGEYVPAEANTDLFPGTENIAPLRRPWTPF